jgi:formate hydrogenlyase subunit 3/multisubunit Na+/H+ antiporter MnhD subunit
MMMVHEAGSATVRSALPGVAVLVPLIGMLVVLAVGDRAEKVRNWLAVAFAAGAFAVCLAMYPTVVSHHHTAELHLRIFLGNFRMAADQMGLLFALIASAIWLAATLYSYNYIQHEQRRTAYHAFNLLCEAACLGVFLSADFFSLFVFFEIMGLAAYPLVVHSQTYEARRAGVKYIFMAVYGGLSLLLGVLLYSNYAGVLGFTARPESAYLTTGSCFLVAGLMMFGFGIKAGMVPLHVWLPLAHPAAPSPASALLSGVMIKAGAFGILRMVQTFQTPASEHVARLAARQATTAPAAEHLAGSWRYLHNLGWVIIILALLTMVTGMVLALVQDNVKRLLAYSSISQMGFILLGVGVGAYLGPEGGIGLAGAMYHTLNHAFFKALLFLGVGAVYYATHELDMTKLGGLWRKMPFTCAFTCIAGLGIMGITAFNGFVSKTLLHHAEVEALQMGGAWLRVVDIVFMVTAGGTICYIAKLISLTFFGRQRSEHAEEAREVPAFMRVAMGALAAGVLAVGLFPGWFMRNLIVPALQPFVGLNAEAVHHLGELKFYTPGNVLAILPPLAIGVVFFLVMRRWDLFRLRLPLTVGVNFYYTRTEVGFLRLCFSGSRRYGELKARYYPMARSAAEYLVDLWRYVYDEYRKTRREVFGRVAGLPMDLAGFTAYVRAVQFTGDIVYGVIIFAVVIAVLAFTLL